MIPSILFTVAVLIILIRSGYHFVQGFNSLRKNWLEIAYHLSVALIALNYFI